MTTEVICALVTVGGTLLSALIAFFVSRTTANKEIEKMQLTWEREDIVSSDDEFAEMASAVARFVAYDSLQNQTEAMEKIAAIRAKEIGHTCASLDLLFRAVTTEDQGGADALLTEVINEKRRLKQDRKTSAK